MRWQARVRTDTSRSPLDARRTFKALTSVSPFRSFVTSYQTFLHTHEFIGDNRLRFAQQLNDMAEHLAELAREADRSRKAGKEEGIRLEKALQDCESNSDKARQKFDSAAEDLERVLLSKAGETSAAANLSTTTLSSASALSRPRTFGKAMSKFKAAKNPAQLQRLEEEARQRMAGANDSYRREVIHTQQVRQEYFNVHVPRILRVRPPLFVLAVSLFFTVLRRLSATVQTLKESADEADLGTQYHLSRYAYLFEHVLVNDGLTVAPLGIEDGLFPSVAPSSCMIHFVSRSTDTSCI
jgi:Rho GTPase-activating protein RGD1